MKAAFEKINITPELPVRLSGFGKIRLAQEVLDPVYARVLYFKGDEEICWIQFDLCGVGDELVHFVKEKTQIEKCLLSTTHTHSGPCGTLNTKKGALNGLDIVFGHYNEEYVEWISDQIASKVNSMRETCEDVMVRINKGRVQELGSDRHDDSYGDEDCLCFEFKTESSNVLLTRLACHPTVMNAENVMISADYCGEIEKNLNYDFVAVVNGSCGDISTRFKRQGNGKEEKERIGKVVSNQMLEFLGNGDYQEVEMKLVQKTFDLDVKEVDSLEVAQDKLQKAMAAVEKAKAQGKSAQELRVITSVLEGAQNNLLASASLGEVSSLALSVSAMKINDQVIIFTPVELFSKCSNPIKEETGFEFVGYTNGYLLYMTSLEAYEKQYYESASSPFKEGVAEEFMQEIKNWVLAELM